MNATELRVTLDALRDSNLLTEEPEYDVFVDLLDEINMELQNKFRQRIEKEMVEEAKPQ